MNILILLLLPLLSFAQSSMDQYRWYLDPDGQEVKVSIDDLHDEIITASPELKWGREVLSSLELKKDITIAVIDGGIEIEHPELKDHIAYNEAECYDGHIIPPKDSDDKDQNGYKGDCAGWDFTENHNRPEDLDSHGTHVAGITASIVRGVKGNIKFLPLKVFVPDEGRQTVQVSTPLPTRLTKAFEYALSRKVDIIHLSVGWPRSIMTYELEMVIKRALEEGVMIIAAAGNSSQRAMIYPCQMEGVICTGALRADGTPARFSNWGSQVDIYAPGEKILSAIPHTLPPLHISRKGYDFKNGTSQAAPFITGVMAVLKGLYPQETSSQLYARLMLGAGHITEGKGLKGMFNLRRSIELLPRSFIFPVLKGIHSVVLSDNEFELTIPFKNFWKKNEKSVSASLTCADAVMVNNIKSFKEDSGILSFRGKLERVTSYLDCSLSFDQEKIEIRLKVLNKLKEPFKKIQAKQDELLVINTRTGAMSRFLTMNVLKGSLPQPLYYILNEKGATLYAEDKNLGTLQLTKGCTFLRIWQADLDGDNSNEFLLESMCDRTHLQYRFLNRELREIYPAVKYKPTLTILNYEDFELILQKDFPPSFRFINKGFNLPSENPWESQTSEQGGHYYELFPVKIQNEFIYDVKILENPKAWQKSLGLRYLPAWEILNVIGERLLVKIGQKTAWVYLHDQSAEWANLDYVLLTGSRKQQLLGTNEIVLQSFLTPYEYRGFLLNGTRLRFIQTDRFDPLIDILGTEKNELGYKTVVRSFQKLIYLQYDFLGQLIDRKESIVDRFDFLTAQDLIASVVNLAFNGSLTQLVDGTKINTNYVDFMKDGKIVSYEIPSHCATQNPVVMEERLVLPVFCAKNKSEFEMRFIDLGE